MALLRTIWNSSDRVSPTCHQYQWIIEVSRLLMFLRVAAQRSSYSARKTVLPSLIVSSISTSFSSIGSTVRGLRSRMTISASFPVSRELSLPKTRFSRNHAHLSRCVPSRGVPRPGGGMGTDVSARAVEQRRRLSKNLGSLAVLPIGPPIAGRSAEMASGRDDLFDRHNLAAKAA